MEFEYAKVKGKIKEKFGTQADFASAMGLSATTISDKLNNKSPWTQKEIDSACVLLGIEPVDIPTYFFTTKVKVL